MGLYNPAYIHKQDEYIVDNSKFTTVQCCINSTFDIMYCWFTESGFKLWIRAWLGIMLLGGYILPWVFIPHPVGIVSVVCYFVYFLLVGYMYVPQRGVDKNIVAVAQYITVPPCLVINIMSLFTDVIDGEQLTWENAENGYEQFRFIAVWVNTVIWVIVLLFDINDSYQYYFLGQTDIIRGKWTTEQLQRNPKYDMKEEPAETKTTPPPEPVKKAAAATGPPKTVRETPTRPPVTQPPVQMNPGDHDITEHSV